MSLILNCFQGLQRALLGFWRPPRSKPKRTLTTRRRHSTLHLAKARAHWGSNKSKEWETYKCNPLNINLAPPPHWRAILADLYVLYRFRLENEDPFYDEEMPGLSEVEVGLGEALEVKGGPLQEQQVWAVLAQAAEAVQDLYLTADHRVNQGVTFPITPDTLLFCYDGHVTFAPSSFDTIPDINYVPPEYTHGRQYAEEENEKMLVFGLGMTMYRSADFKLGEDEALSISDSLDSLLGAMCEEDPELRASLMQVLEACATSRASSGGMQQVASSHHIISLYKLVLGSDPQISPQWPDEDPERDYIPRRKHRSHSRSKSRSKSRSRSRSRSQSRDRHSAYLWPDHERPHPDGKDQSIDGRDGYYGPPPRSPLPYARGSGGGGGRPPVSPYSRGRSYPQAPTEMYPPTVMQPVGLEYPRVVLQAAEPMHRPPYGSKAYPSRRSPYHHQQPAYHPAAGYPPEPPIRDPNVRHTYQRLKERQRKLQALRHGLEVPDDVHDISDVMSMRSEITDFGERRSMISSNSYTQGVYQPDLWQYGPEVALQMGRGPGGQTDLDVPDWIAEDEDEWIARQQQQHKAQVKAMTAARSVVPPPQRTRTPSPAPPPQPTKSSKKQKQPAAKQQQHTPSAARKKKAKPKPKPKLVQREHYGPEFTNANSPIVSAYVPQARIASPSSLRHVIVVLLGGQKLDVTCEVNTLAKDVMEAVVTHLTLTEHYYFGLAFLYESEYFFLEGETKLSKVTPSSWKDPGKGSTPSPFTMFLRVKFYVDAMDMLKHPQTQHLYYLQLRRDILEERCQTNEEQALTLAGIALQAEYGDWQDRAKDAVLEQYISPRIIRRLGRQNCRDNLPSRHSVHLGLGDKEAEKEYIKEMLLLPEYGLHFYKVFRSKKETHLPIWTGIGVRGILMAENAGELRSVTHRHPWHLTQKISFNRRRFSVLPKQEMMGPNKTEKLNYYTESYKKGRYLLQLSTAHHRFQMMMRMRADQPDMTQIMHRQPSDEEEEELDEPELDDQEVHDDYPEQDMEQEHDELDNSFEDYSDQEQMPVERPYENVKMKPKPKSRAAIAEWADSTFQHPTQSTRPAVPGAYSMPDIPIASTIPSQADKQERRIVMVELHKDDLDGIGITIVGGENTGKLDLGIFVKSVTPGGPAARDGRVRPGDRIIAINGQSLEGIPHHKAVVMMRESPPVVHLLLSQPQSRAGAHMNRQLRNEEPQVEDGDDEISLNEMNVEEMNMPIGARRQSIGSSDLELEDVVPRVALSPQYAHQHMSTPVDGIGDSDDQHADNKLESDGYLTEDDTEPQSQILNTEHLQIGDQYKIILEKKDQSLGLNVTGGRNTTVKHGGIYVKSFQPGGAAEQDGRIRIGDRVLEVNHVRLDGFTHKEAVETLREAQQVSNLLMVRGALPRPHSNPSSSDGGAPGSSISPIPAHGSPVEPVHHVTICKDAAGLGFSVVGGVDTSRDPVHRLPRIKKLAPGGAAERTGRLQPGDVLIKVDDQEISGRTHEEMLRALQATGKEVHLTVSRPLPGSLPSIADMGSIPPRSPRRPDSRSSGRSTSPLPAPVQPVHHVTICKDAAGLGITVIGGVDTSRDPVHRLPRIKQLVPGGAAERTGRLQPGDVLIKVDEEEVLKCTHEEMLTALRATGKEVHLTISRPLPGSLPAIFKALAAGEIGGRSTPTKMRTIGPLDNESDGEEDYTQSHSRLSNHTSMSQRTASPDIETYPISEKSRSPSASFTEKTRTPSPANFRSRTPSPMSQHRRTPTPVQSFLKDAGLGSVEATPQPTPRESLEQLGREEAEGDEDEEESPRDEEYEVMLTKGDKGLGFTVAGGAHSTGFFYVKDVLYDPALSTGIISPGDRLIQVNGQDMRGLDHKEAVNYLRQTPTTVLLRFSRPPLESDDSREESEEDEEEEEEIRPPVQERKRVSFRLPRAVEKWKSSPNGMVASMIAQMEDKKTMIKPYQYQQPATQPGYEYDDEVEASSFGDVTLPLSDGSDGETEDIPQDMPVVNFPDSGVIQTALHKNAQGSLGFTLIQGEKGSSSALFIRSIVENGPAEHDDRLRIGDRLLQVNGETVIGMVHSKAVALIKRAKGPVHITVSRAPSRPSSAKNPQVQASMAAQQQQLLLEKFKSASSSSIRVPSPDENMTSMIDSVTPGGQHEQDSDSEEDDDADPKTFDSLEGQEAMRRLGAGSPGQGDGNTDEDSWNDDEDSEEDEVDMPYEMSKPKQPPPQKPPRKNPLARLPSSISDAWLDSLPLVTIPTEAIHYQGRQLENTIKGLRAALRTDDPIEEYKSLRHAKLTDNCNDARTTDNKAKNRYRNVLPYDATRVRLSEPDDYINASYVRYSVGKTWLHYIACQGPMPHTTADFWRMIWEQKAQVIAMVTQETEGGKVKCHHYWPEAIGAPFVVNNRFEVSITQIQHLTDFDINYIKMEDLNTGQSHRVTHLNYSTWPDHGTPQSGGPILKYIRFLHLVHDTGPIVVHCSAGIGRTGALITIDVVLALIERDLKFDIQRVVEELRRQRQGMIQTKDQYNYCYKSVLEALESLQHKDREH